jgi:two-component system KDP operon response regulator KdpE
MQRILVIGERPEEAKAMAFRLGLSGYEAMPSASESTLALRSLFAFKPDAVILSAGVNHGSRDLFRLLASVSQLPILVLGDGKASDDLVWYLEEGAVDYLARPVGIPVISARLTAVLRRMPDQTERGTITIGTLEIDRSRHRVTRRGQPICLTPTEFRLLEVLAENAGRPCSHRMLLEKVWGKDFASCAHYLRLYIGYLRQKIEDNPRDPRMLTTDWGLGYRLAADPAESRARAARARMAIA